MKLHTFVIISIDCKLIYFFKISSLQKRWKSHLINFALCCFKLHPLLMPIRQPSAINANEFITTVSSLRNPMSSQFHSSNSAAPRNGAFEPKVKNQQRTNDLLISVYDAENSEEFESKYFNVLPHSSKSQVCTSYRNRFQTEGVRPKTTRRNRVSSSWLMMTVHTWTCVAKHRLFCAEAFSSKNLRPEQVAASATTVSYSDRSSPLSKCPIKSNLVKLIPYGLRTFRTKKGGTYTTFGIR